MAKQVLEARIRQKTDTLANWMNNDLVLLGGEPAYILNADGTPVNFRIGDGTKTFAELPDWIKYDQAAYSKVTGTTLPASDGQVHYTILGAGTYTQTGGVNVVIPAGSLGIVSNNGTTWGIDSTIQVKGDKGEDGASLLAPWVSGQSYPLNAQVRKSINGKNVSFVNNTAGNTNDPETLNGWSKTTNDINVTNQTGQSTTDAVSQKLVTDIQDELNKTIDRQASPEYVFGFPINTTTAGSISNLAYIPRGFNLINDTSSISYQAHALIAGVVTVVFLRPNQDGSLTEYFRTTLTLSVGSNTGQISVDVKAGDKYAIIGSGIVSYYNQSGGGYYEASSSTNPLVFSSAQASNVVNANVKLNFNITFSAVDAGLKQQVESLNTSTTSIQEDVLKNANDILSLSDSLSIKNDFILQEYVNNTSNAASNGTIHVSKRVVVNGGSYKRIFINVVAVSGTAPAEISFVLYNIASDTLTIKSRSELITVPYTGAGVYEIPTTFQIEPDSRLALGVQTGVAIRYNGSAPVSGGFLYIFNQGASAISKPIGTLLTGSQNFNTAAGWGYEISEYSNEKLNSDNIATIDYVDDKILNYLEGKKINVTGDSTIRGHTLPISQVWASLIGVRNNMTVNNYGINGNALVEGRGTGTPLVLRYQEMDSSADYTIVGIGTNDAAGAVPMGTDTSTDATTFKGALNVLCSGLLTMMPSCKIGFITPELRNNNYLPYIEAIKTICAKYSIAVFDNAKDGGVCWSNSAQVNALTLGDSYHLNQAGMLRKSYTYESFIRSL